MVSEFVWLCSMLVRTTMSHRFARPCRRQCIPCRSGKRWVHPGIVLFVVSSRFGQSSQFVAVVFATLWSLLGMISVVVVRPEWPLPAWCLSSVGPMFRSLQRIALIYSGLCYPDACVQVPCSSVEGAVCRRGFSFLQKLSGLHAVVCGNPIGESASLPSTRSSLSPSL